MICNPSTLLAVAALALCASTSPVLAQDAATATITNFDAVNATPNVAAQPNVDMSTGDEDRSADSLALTASNDAATTIDNENRADGDALVVGANVLSSWSNLELNSYAVQVLVDALSNPKLYDPTIAAPVCVLQINSGTFQPVSGTNYRYKILGCAVQFSDDLGACTKRDCASTEYDVTVYEQTWTDTLQVSSITQSV